MLSRKVIQESITRFLGKVVSYLQALVTILLFSLFLKFHTLLLSFSLEASTGPILIIYSPQKKRPILIILSHQFNEKYE